MKFKSMASLLTLSFTLLTAIPVVAAEAQPAKLTHLARHHRAACRVTCRRAAFGMSIERRPIVQDQSPPNTSKDDWPHNMILDSFRSHELSNAGKIAAAYVI
jgi:hypothetical protein